MNLQFNSSDYISWILMSLALKQVLKCYLDTHVTVQQFKVDLVGLKPVLRTTTSFSALTLLVGSFDL